MIFACRQLFPRKGIRFLIEAAALLEPAFPDLQLTTEDMVAEGDKVATRWRESGTNTGPTYNPAIGGWNPPTGKPFTYTGLTLSQVRDGMVVSDTYECNWTDMLIQMGSIPNPFQSPG